MHKPKEKSWFIGRRVHRWFIGRRVHRGLRLVWEWKDTKMMFILFSIFYVDSVLHILVFNHDLSSKSCAHHVLQNVTIKGDILGHKKGLQLHLFLQQFVAKNRGYSRYKKVSFKYKMPSTTIKNLRRGFYSENSQVKIQINIIVYAFLFFIYYKGL